MLHRLAHNFMSETQILVFLIIF